MAHRSTRSLFSTAPAIVALALFATASFSPPLWAAGDLPAGEAVLAKLIDAEGGAAALRKVKSRVITMSIDLGSGLMGKGKSYHARPDKHYTSVDITGMGSIEEGCSGGVAWEMAAMMGPRIKEGGERALALREAHFDGLLDWKSMYEKIECVAREPLDGKDYYKLELTAKEGDVVTLYIDSASYLLHRTDMTLETPMATLGLSIISENYSAVDGIQYPMKSTITIQGMPQKRVITLEKVEHNVDIPEDRFNYPADIQALLDKAKDSAEEKTEGND